ncbi:MAG: ABC transporter permease [Planctomycetes bacterium]|nr:ABC transporter permease [Planctomycetota bacterium]
MDMRRYLHHFRYVIIILVLCAGLSIATPAFLSFTNLTNVLWSVSVIGIIAVGATFAMLVGKIDLAVGRTSAIAGIVATIAIVEWNIHYLPGICLGLLCAAGFGLINGCIVAYSKVPDFIATFAMSSIILGIGQVWTRGTTISIMQPREFTFLGTGKVLAVPMPVIIFIAATFLGMVVLTKTVFGRQCYCVGGNRLAARLSGIAAERIIVITYVITGLMAGLGGVVHTALSQQAGPHMGGGYELDVIAAISSAEPA